MVEVKKFYTSGDVVFARKFLKDNDISYIYWVKPQRAVLGDLQLNLTNVFENKTVVIYKVN